MEQLREPVEGDEAPFGKLLVEDVSVGDVADDRLGHDSVASNLQHLVMSVATPATIGLFGSWGSGKSGIGNLLAANLRDADAVFVRIDAFRHSGIALTRAFVSEVAETIGGSAKAHIKRLSGKRTESSRTVKLSRTGWVGLSAVLAILLGVAILLAALAGSADAAAATRPISGLAAAAARLPQTMQLVLSGALLATIITIMAHQLSIDITTDPPAELDQFDDIFRDVIGAAGRRRVVIFIDELDRCAADEVTATLQWLRTFLSVPGCVFVVAADQHMLEKAVKDAGGQVTPNEPDNPYHSAGSALIDKVFPYRVVVPPIPSRRLTRYAESLVADRSGFWNDVNAAAVMQVLVPSHVRSPRRVKVLINTYALQYEILMSRTRAGMLPPGTLPTRAVELAKLVCLQVEFPLFAADLAHHPDLPGALVELIKDPSTEREFGVGTVDRARTYLNGRARLDQDLADGDACAADAARLDQLKSYLLKTSRVLGPGPELIFSEDPGHAWGLPQSTADRLESAAIDGRQGEVVSLVSAMQPAQRLGAARLLVSLLGEVSRGGVEGSNLVVALVAVLGTLPSEELTTLAPAAMQSLAGHDFSVLDTDGRYSLADLAASTTDPSGQALLAAIIETDDPEFLAARLVERDAARHHPLFARRVARELLDDGASAHEAVDALASGSEDALQEICDGLYTELVDQARQRRAAELSNAPGDAVAADRQIGPESTTERLVGMVEASSRAAGPLRELIQVVALEVCGADAVPSVQRHLAGPIASDKLQSAALANLASVSLVDWPRWLRAIDRVPDQLASAAGQAPAQAIAAVFGGDAGHEVLGQLHRVLELMADMEPFSAGLTAVESRCLRELQDTNGTIHDALVALAVTHVLHRLNILTDSAAVTALEEATALLASEFGLEGNEEAARWWDSAYGTPETWFARADTERIAAFASAAEAAQHVPASDRAWLTLRTLAELRSRGAELPDVAIRRPEALLSIAGSGSLSKRVVAAWVEASDSPDDTWKLAAEIMNRPDGLAIADALGDRASRDDAFKRTVIRLALADSGEIVFTPEFVAALQIDSSVREDVFLGISTAYSASTTAEQRIRIVRNWSRLPEVLTRRQTDDMIDRVLVPVATGSKGGLTAVCRNLNLGARASNQGRARLRDACQSAAAAWHSTAATERALEEVGFLRRSRSGLFGTKLVPAELPED